jgi:hypothetical protein
MLKPGAHPRQIKHEQKHEDHKPEHHTPEHHGSGTIDEVPKPKKIE